MPFDGTTHQVESEAVKALRHGRERVRRGWFSVFGLVFNPRICAWMALPNDGREGAEQALMRAAGVASLKGIFDWNDKWYRTRRQVVRLYDRAIADELAA